MRRGSHWALSASAYSPVTGRERACGSSSCTISRNDCDVAEQKKKKVPSFFALSLAQLRKSSYLCTAIENKSFSDWALSSAGSERLPYKQRVGGSNPSAPTFFQTAIHRKMGSCFFVRERNGGGWGDTRKLGGRLCAKPASTGRVVVCFCVGMSVGCSFSCERVCAVAIGVWCTSSRNRSMGGVVL